MAEKPVLDELALFGLRLSAIADLSRRPDCERAIPVLLRWLGKVNNAAVKEDIVRALSVPWARPIAAAPLINEFTNADMKTGVALKWAIGNALSIVADDGSFEAIADLARDRRHGRAREMLVLALGRMTQPAATDVLMELLADDEVAGHAIIALGKLRAERAKARIIGFQDHKMAWIRREARKAIKRIEARRV